MLFFWKASVNFIISLSLQYQNFDFDLFIIIYKKVDDVKIPGPYDMC